MSPVFSRPRALGLLLVTVIGFAAYQVWDTRTLKREADGLAKLKASELLAQAPQRFAASASPEVSVWRMVPLVGAPQAKVTVRLRLTSNSGQEISQTFDYFYRRRGTMWAEEQASHGRDPALTGAAAHCH